MVEAEGVDGFALVAILGVMKRREYAYYRNMNSIYKCTRFLLRTSSTLHANEDVIIACVWCEKRNATILKFSFWKMISKAVFLNIEARFLVES